MRHHLKAIGWPEARDVPNWPADARLLCGDAARRFWTPDVAGMPWLFDELSAA